MIKDNKIMLAYVMGLLLIALPTFAAQQECEAEQCDVVEQFVQDSNIVQESVITDGACHSQAEAKFDGAVRAGGMCTESAVRAGGMYTGEEQLITKKGMALAAVRACGKLGMTGLLGCFLKNALTDDDSGTLERLSLGWVTGNAAYGVYKELAYIKKGILGCQAPGQKIQNKKRIINMDGIVATILDLSWLATDLVLGTYANWTIFDKIKPKKTTSFADYAIKSWLCWYALKSCL